VTSRAVRKSFTEYAQLLKDAAEVHNLVQLTVEEGFKNGGGECQPILFGIDARYELSVLITRLHGLINISIWMYQVDRAIQYGNTGRGPNPHLRALFYKLAALLELPIRGVFVFDGPERPDLKRNTRVVTHGHWLTPQFLQLIHFFGYHSHTVWHL
jgi:hypothetical protein